MKRTTSAFTPLPAMVYLAVDDAACRARITEALEGHGASVITRPTGYHLIESIAEAIEGRGSWPALIAVDARSRGCHGTTIAAGLRELGVRVPIVLIARPDDPIPSDPTVHRADPAHAADVIVELLRRRWMVAAEPTPRRALA